MSQRYFSLLNGVFNWFVSWLGCVDSYTGAGVELSADPERVVFELTQARWRDSAAGSRIIISQDATTRRDTRLESWCEL